jgi:predicted amidohydrolase
MRAGQVVMGDPGHSRSFRVGLVQMCSGREVERNVNDATTLIRQAKREGADYIQTPEMTTAMELDRARLLSVARPEAGNPAIAHFRSLARELGVYLHIG